MTIYIDEQTDIEIWIHIQVHKKQDRWNHDGQWIDGKMESGIDGQLDQLMDGWMDGWKMDRQDKMVNI